MKALSELLLDALHAAKRAGSAMMEVYRQPFAVEHKSDASPLTQADKSAHEAIIDYLQRESRSTLPILSEEGTRISYEERRRWESFWLVDPLDGTKEFIRKNGEFTVNIALVRDHMPVLGVVYAPALDRCYFALEGLGAYRTEGGTIDSSMSLDRLLAASEGLPLSHHSEKTMFTIAGSRSHANEELDTFVESMRMKYGAVAFLSAGSSLKLCLVGEGRADIYPRPGTTMEWDTAAGQAVVENASGCVVDWDARRPLQYNKENLQNPWFVAMGNGISL